MFGVPDEPVDDLYVRRWFTIAWAPNLPLEPILYVDTSLQTTLLSKPFWTTVLHSWSSTNNLPWKNSYILN